MNSGGITSGCRHSGTIPPQDFKRELGQAFGKSSQVIALLKPYLGDNQFIINRYCGQNCSAQRIIRSSFCWCEANLDISGLLHALASVLSLL